MTPRRVHGPVGRGSPVTGRGFAAGVCVTIGRTTVAPTVVSATSFTFITPAEPAGSVPVQLTTAFGPRALTSAHGYTYGRLQRARRALAGRPTLLWGLEYAPAS